MHDGREFDKIAQREVLQLQSKHIEKEWQQLLRAEQSFLSRNMSPRSVGWQEKIAKFVPDKLENTLNTAFYKAFDLIFDKGTEIIEKTYQKDKKEQNYKHSEKTNGSFRSRLNTTQKVTEWSAELPAHHSVTFLDL